MLNYYYKDSICSFLTKSVNQVIGEITLSNQFDSNLNQNHSWVAEIHCLQESLQGMEVPFSLNSLYLEWEKEWMH